MIIHTFSFCFCDLLAQIGFVISVPLRQHLRIFEMVLCQVECSAAPGSSSDSLRHDRVLQQRFICLVQMLSDSFIRLHHVVRFGVAHFGVRLLLLP